MNTRPLVTEEEAREALAIDLFARMIAFHTSNAIVAPLWDVATDQKFKGLELATIFDYLK